MELYVAKEIKDKVEPLEENLRDREKQIEKLATRLKTLDEQLRGVDKKHVGISNAILSKQGIILGDITELNILREYARIHEKEAQIIKERKNRKQSSMSPKRNVDNSPTERDMTTNYLTKLAPMAFDRK